MPSAFPYDVFLSHSANGLRKASQLSTFRRLGLGAVGVPYVLLP